MPVVPMSPTGTTDPVGVPTGAPSQTNMLMALAQMKNLGRIPSADDNDRATHNVARLPKQPPRGPKGK